MTDTTPTSALATASAPELKTYHGNCHCGAVKYTVTLPEITSVTECDCSLCHRKGHRSLFPSGELDFEEGKGEDKLKSYEFAGKNITHKFCPTCGTAVMARGSADSGMNIGINARTLNEIDDIFSLKVNPYNGTTVGPGYTPHAFTGSEPTATIEDPKTYYGSCHCGAITMAFKTAGPLPEGSEKIQQCNCSICCRNGTILTYPHKTQISIHSPTIPPTPLSIYTFGRKFQQHTFCPICSVAISIQKNSSVNPELFKKEAPAGADQKQWEETLPVNLRCFEGVEWDRVKVENRDGKNYGGKYEVPA